jgi:hypothetical protein
MIQSVKPWWLLLLLVAPVVKSLMLAQVRQMLLPAAMWN